MRKITTAILTLLLLCGCSGGVSTEGLAGPVLAPKTNEKAKDEKDPTPAPTGLCKDREDCEKESADMSGYGTLPEETDNFVKTDVASVIAAIDNKETFVVYFGFEGCPWCKEALPILKTLSDEYGIKVNYVDTREKEEYKSNVDIDNYDLLVERLGEYFSLDEDGKRHLYVPFVFFINEGEVALAHEGTIDEHNAKERTLTENEVAILTEIYRNGFEALQAE